MDDIDLIAEAVKRADNKGATLRIGKITAIETTGSFRVKLDTLGDTWLESDGENQFEVGERCYALVQGPTGVVVGKLANAAPAMPIGAVVPYAGASGTTFPTGWKFCNGQAVSRTDYALLFSRLGTTYGAGDGSTTFNLPDLEGRVVVASGTGGPFSDYFNGNTGGVESVTLTTAQIPAHDHGSTGAHTHSTVTTSIIPAPSTTGQQVADNTAGQTGSAGAHTHASVGGSGSHENRMPYIALYYIIRCS